MKNANDVARYIRPMVLWSVVRSRLDSREPFSATWAGLGRLTMGAGAIVTSGSLDGARAAPQAERGGAPVHAARAAAPPRTATASRGRSPAPAAVRGDVDGRRSPAPAPAGAPSAAASAGRRQVPGVRAHADERRDGGAVEGSSSPVARPSRTGCRCGSSDAASRAALSGSTRSRPERADELRQVVGRRRHHDQPAVGPQHPGDLRPVARGEDHQHPVDDGVPDRQPGPAVGDHRDRPRVGPRRPAGGVARGVQDDAHRVGQRGRARRPRWCPVPPPRSSRVRRRRPPPARRRPAPR